MGKKELLNLLRDKGFSLEILNAFSKVPRERFMPKSLESEAYDNFAKPIGHDQTISQPYTIALMLEMLELKAGQKVLELGSGSGYVLALLSEIVGEKGKVFGVERIRELSNQSKMNLEHYKNIQVYCRNGTNGLPEHKFYDRILISAACKEIPKNLLSQLKFNGGRLVAPVGDYDTQWLTTYTRDKDKIYKKTHEKERFIFVPFVKGD